MTGAARSAAYELHELRSPAVYPSSANIGAGDIEIVQTHISVVCIAGDRVYKLKKAVTLPFLDFGSLQLRERACHDEVRLNRRLCPHVYLGVVALRRTPAGLRFGADGDGVVDWAVAMVRLPAERMMDRLLRENRVTVVEVAALAQVIAAFHARASRAADVVHAGRPERLAELATENFAETAVLAGTTFDAGLHAALAARTRDDFARLLPELRRRRDEGRVVEGHGDLHARNVCLTAPPLAYDCIEFSLELRCGDVATENAFLAMDLRYRGHRALADAYVDAYERASGDRGMRGVLPPLIRYRAMVRAKVAALAAADEGVPAADRAGALQSARRHARLAAASAVEEQRLWLVASGLPVSGKSFVLEQLARETGWPHVATDHVRKELVGLAPTARGGPEIYAPDVNERTYGEVLARAARAGPVVLLDGTFASAARRAQTAAAARAAGAAAFFVWFDVPEDVVRERMRQRRQDATAVSDADLRVYYLLRASFTPPLEVPHVRLAAERPADQLLDALLAALLAWTPAAA